MELYQLRSFVAVAEVGQLTRAAEKLHISQPALSAQIRALEDGFGLELFERTASGMVLTAAGRRILVQALQILAAVQAMNNQAQAFKGQLLGKASIGTLSDPEFIRLGEFMAGVVDRYPLLELELQQEITGAAMEHVDQGKLDASFYYGELNHPNVAGLALRQMIYRITAPADWEERLKNATWKEIAELPWIVPPAISTHHQLMEKLMQKHGVEATKLVGADLEAVVSSLVVSGLGMALMREDSALEKAAAGEVCLWSGARISTTLWFIYRAEREKDPLIEALIEVLHDVWKLNRLLPAPPKPAQHALVE